MKNDYFNLKQIQKLKFSAICSDSRKVIPQALFVALKGHKGDGHLYLKSAIQKGASALLVENKDALKGLCFSGPVGVVKNTKIALPFLLNSFYNYPSEKMFCVGVTGTNGKSTVAHIMAFLFTRLGWRTGLLGSIVNRFEEWEEKKLSHHPRQCHWTWPVKSLLPKRGPSCGDGGVQYRTGPTKNRRGGF